MKQNESGHRKVRLALLAAALVTLACCSCAHAATIGANVGGLLPPPGPPPPGAFQTLQALRAEGATTARADGFWQAAEPQPPVDGVHRYDWSYDDMLATMLSAAGLRWEPDLDYATWWAANPNGGEQPGVAPAYVPDFVAYAAAFAARYGPGGTFWLQNPQLPQLPVEVIEIWNEEDLLYFWGPKTDLAEYAAMYLESRAAIRAVDPRARVIIGGLWAPNSSLPAMVAAEPGLVGNVDGVGIHPYAKTPDEMQTKLTEDLQTDSQTVDAPLYVNEYGWKASKVAEPTRSQWIETMTEALAQNPYVADVELYCWGCGGEFDIFGTPSANAFGQAIGAMAPVGSSTTSPTQEPPASAPVVPPTGSTKHAHRRHRRHRHHHRHHRHRHHRHHRHHRSR